MLNCCIRHKKAQEHSQSGTSDAQFHSCGADIGSSGDHSVEISKSRTSPEGEGSDTDEEFFEALESQDQSFADVNRSQDRTEKQSPIHSKASEVSPEDKLGMGDLERGRSGVLKRCGDLVLIATGEPLCIPVTQVYCKNLRYPTALIVQCIIILFIACYCALNRVLHYVSPLKKVALHVYYF